MGAIRSRSVSKKKLKAESCRLTASNAARAVAWTALAKLADKEARGDLLAEGVQPEVCLSVSAEVDGLAALDTTAQGTLFVGHPSQRASSSAPKLVEVVAYFLGCLPAAQRERTVRELPEAFAAAGGKLPIADPLHLAAAENLCERLRVKTVQTVRAPVSLQYTLE